jgi:Protein of unknown function (DUF3499)
MSSGPKWSLRNGSQYQRLCARAGCGAPASVTLRFQPTQRQAWLVELDEHSARTQGDLCNRHADALVLPRGWELHDERAPSRTPELGDATDATTAAQNGNGKATRRVRVPRKAAPTDDTHGPAPLPGLEPAAASDETTADGSGEPATNGAATVRFGAGDDDVEEALGAILDARTPLLQRAFRNSKPQQ